MSAVRILGLGEWVPEEIRGNDAFVAARTGAGFSGERTFNDIPVAREGELATIVEKPLAAEAEDPFLGVRVRRVAAETDSAREAEAMAAAAALRDAGIEGADVDVVLSYSIVTDHVVATGPHVAHAIGAHRATAFAIDAACASAVAQLELALALVASGRAKVVVATQSHLMLRAMPMSHPATPCLGDGATAFVVAKSDRADGLLVRDVYTITEGEHYEAVLWVRDEAEERTRPWWEAGSAFRLGSLRPEGAKALMRDTVSLGRATIRALADRIGEDVTKIAVIAAVQPRGFLPGAIASSLDLDADVAVTTYEDRGHLGGSGPITNLIEARRRGRLAPGTPVVLYAQGAGFTRAAAWLEAS